jgi:hypothetical protein
VAVGCQAAREGALESKARRAAETFPHVLGLRGEGLEIRNLAHIVIEVGAVGEELDGGIEGVEGLLPVLHGELVESFIHQS